MPKHYRKLKDHSFRNITIRFFRSDTIWDHCFTIIYPLNLTEEQVTEANLFGKRVCEDLDKLEPPREWLIKQRKKLHLK